MLFTRVTAVLLIFVSALVYGQAGDPVVSLTYAPIASMQADSQRYEPDGTNNEKFNMNLHQGLGVRVSAWSLYASISRSVTEVDTEIPNAEFTAISAGFLLEEIAEDSAPVGLYSRFGAGIGRGELAFADAPKNEKDLLWEVFAEGGLTFAQYYQLGLQGKLQGLFKVGDTRGLLGELAVVVSVHF